MKYKHHTLLPIGSFHSRGSVVGGRGMRLHGDSDDWPQAEEDPADAFRSHYEYALEMAAKGFPRILEDLKASGQIEQFQAKEAETAAINQAATQIAESRQPFDLSQFAGSDYERAAELANWHLSRGDPQGYAQQFIDEAAQGLASIQAENKKQADLEAKYGNVRFGTGFGQALGYEYGLKNAYGDIYQKYDAQGNLTEYLDKNGRFIDTSTIKPTGFEGFDESGKPITGYQHPEYGTLFNNVNNYAPMMSPFSEDQGGWLGEGGWSRIGGLVAAGLTAGLAGGAFSSLGLGTPFGATGAAASLVPGSAAAIGTAVAQGSLTSVALAGLQGASPQEMLKAGLTGAISAGISSYLPTAGLTSFEQAAARIGTQTGLAAITGGDVKNALISSILSSSLSTVMTEALPKDVLDSINSMPPEARKVLMSTLNSTLMAGVQGGDISDAAISGVTNGLKSVATDFAKGVFKDFKESDFAKSFSNTFGSDIGEIEEPGGTVPYAPDDNATLDEVINNLPTTPVADYTDPEAFNAALIAAMQNPVAPGPASEGLASGPVNSDAGPSVPPVATDSERQNALRLYNEAMQELGRPTAESVNDPNFLSALERVTSPTGTGTGGTGTGSIYDDLEDPGGLYDVINPNAGAVAGTGGTGTGSIFDDLEDPGGVQDIINGSYGANTGLPAGLYRIGSGIQDLPNQGILSAAGTPLALTGDLKSVIDNIARGAEESGMTALVEDNGQLIANALYNAGLKGGVTPEQAQEIVSRFFSNPGDLNAYRMDVGRIANIDLTPPAPPPPVAPPVTPPATPPVISQPPIEEIEDVPVMPEPPKPPEPEKEKEKSKEKGGEGTKPADEPTPVVTPTPTAPTPTSDDAQKAADDAQKAADDAAAKKAADDAQKAADDQAAADRASQAAAAAKATADKAAAEAKAAADKSAAEAKVAADKAASDKAAADKATADKAAEAKAAAEKSAAEAKAAADKAAADKAASDKAASDKAASDKAAAEAKAAADKAAADKAASDKAMAEKAAADKAAADKAASDKAASDKAAADKAASDKAAADKVISDNQAATAKLISDLDAKVAANEKAGMTRDEATGKAVKDLAKNLGTTEQALKDSIAASQTGLKTDIESAKTDLTKLIAANEAAGLSRSEASDKAIKDLADSLGMTEQALKDSIASSQSDLLTEIGAVKTGLSGDIEATKSELAKLIEDNEAAGLSRSDATDKAVSDLAASLGTTEKALKDSIAASQTGLETTIGEVKTGLSTDIAGVKSDLTKLIEANEKAGMTRSDATDKAIKDLSGSLGTTEKALKDAIATSQTGIEKNIEGVKTDLTKLITDNEAAGLTRSEASDKAIKDLAASLGTTEQALKDSIAASQTGLETNIAGVKSDLTKLITDNEAAGLTRSEASDKAIKDLAASLGTTEQALKDSIASSQTGLETAIGDVKTGLSTDIAGVKSDLTTLIANNEAAGLTRDQATNQAVKDLATSLGTTEQALLDAIGSSQSGLESLIGGVKTGLETSIGGVKSDLETGLTGVKSDINNVKDALQKQIADNEAAGLTRSEATNKAVSDLSSQLGTTEKGLIDAIQGVATDLSGQLSGVKTDLTGQMGDIEGRLAAQIAANEAAGMGRDEAFSSAVAGLGTQIGGLGTQIGGIGQGLTGLQEGLAGLSAGFGSYQAANAKAAATKQKQEQGQQLLNMLTSQGKGEVKSAPLASIGYMYDVGGESIFATPKQESLFLSPFEDAPSPVEGAMPKYQYADGGLIGNEDLQNIDDLYEMLRSK